MAMLRELGEIDLPEGIIEVRPHQPEARVVGRVLTVGAKHLAAGFDLGEHEVPEGRGAGRDRFVTTHGTGYVAQLLRGWPYLSHVCLTPFRRLPRAGTTVRSRSGRDRAQRGWEAAGSYGLGVSGRRTLAPAGTVVFCEKPANSGVCGGA